MDNITKYYAVLRGKTPGIYTSWNDAKKQVIGFKNAIYKSFTTLEEAEIFMSKEKEMYSDKAIENKNVSFVDGSFNKSTGVYGYGGFIIHTNDDGTKTKTIVQGSGSDKDMACMRNIAGEILGARAAIEKALELGYDELVIIYDYIGIEMWATGEWKCNKEGTKSYHDFIQSIKDKIKLKFVKVKGHTGVDGNEEVDRLAKEACGINVK